MLRVRKVEASDAPAIILIGREGIESSAYRGVTFSPMRALESLAECLDRPDVFFGLIAERDGEPVGLKYAYVSRYFFSTDIVCYDLATYVIPSARSFTLINMMVRAYRRWAESVGACRAYLGATAMPGDPRVGKLYTRLGFLPAGSLHVMEIGHGQVVPASTATTAATADAVSGD